MWIFSEMGFFSLTRSRVEPELIQARTRSLEDARALALYVERTLDRKPRIIETPAADYIARVLLKPSEAAVIMAAMVEGIGYSNFKSHIDTTPQSDKLPALHDIWHIMHEYQLAKIKRDNRRGKGWDIASHGEPDPIAELADWAGEPPADNGPPVEHSRIVSWKLKGTKRKGRWSAVHYTLDNKQTLCGLVIPNGASNTRGLGSACQNCERIDCKKFEE